MKILMITTYGESAALAYRFKNDGHQVFMWIKDPRYETVMDGIIEKVGNWKEWIDDVDLIVFSYTGFGKKAEELKNKGYCVIGGTEYTDELELDRGFGQEQMEDAGLTVLPTSKFTYIDDAIDHVKQNPKKYVIKPNGKGSDDKALTYVGQEKDGKDVISQLEHYEKKYAKNIESLELQEKVDGIEIGIGGFFNGKDFVEPVQVDFEHKKLFPGDIGPNTGEMGTMTFWTNKNHPLYQKVLVPMISRIQGYTGYFNINCIVNEQGIFLLEPTCRFGYPTIEMKMETIYGDFGKFMYNLSMGSTNPVPVDKSFSVCVVIATPPFPYDDQDNFDKYSKDNLVIIKSEDKEGYHPSEIYEEDGKWYVGGFSGYVMVVTGSGESMKEAKEMAYNRVKEVIIPNMFYRNDIADKWEENEQKLQELGLLGEEGIQIPI